MHKIGGLLLPEDTEKDSRNNTSNTNSSLPFDPKTILTTLISVAILSVVTAFWQINNQIAQVKIDLSSVRQLTKSNQKRIQKLEAYCYGITETTRTASSSTENNSKEREKDGSTN